jgi:uncharacterized membrane protein YccC
MGANLVAADVARAEHIAKDAANRAWRTWLQSLVVAAVTAAGSAVFSLVQSGGLSGMSWAATGSAVGTGAGMAVVSFVWRRWLDPSRVPSAAPAEDAAPAVVPAAVAAPVAAAVPFDPDKASI